MAGKNKTQLRKEEKECKRTDVVARRLEVARRIPTVAIQHESGLAAFDGTVAAGAPKHAAVFRSFSSVIMSLLSRYVLPADRSR